MKYTFDIARRVSMTGLTLLTLTLLSITACKRLKLPSAGMHIDAEERAAAAKLKPAVDPIRTEISRFRQKMHEAFGESRWDELEKTADGLRAEKALFGNGEWKLRDFYEGLTCQKEAAAPVWKQAESLHLAWITAKPQSVTPRVAYAEFLTNYAWEARGSGYANTVTEEGWRLYEERLQKCREVLTKAKALGKDPMLWMLFIRSGFGAHLNKAEFDAMVSEGHAEEPTFWHLDNGRAYSLLPRWFGKRGDWEAFAWETADRPDGLGDEAYARIVIGLTSFHENIFHESKADWGRTLAGLKQLRKKYPTVPEFTSYAALLATMANDRPEARAMFAELGDTYLPRIWRSPERFVHFRKWAETGKW